MRNKLNLGDSYVIKRDSTGDDIPCRLDGIATFGGDKQQFFVFSMDPPFAMIKDARDGSTIERSILAATVDPVVEMWGYHPPQPPAFLDLPVFLFAFPDEAHPTESYKELDPIGRAVIYEASNVPSWDAGDSVERG